MQSEDSRFTLRMASHHGAAFASESKDDLRDGQQTILGLGIMQRTLRVR
jgi:hypothetical protein